MAAASSFAQHAYWDTARRHVGARPSRRSWLDGVLGSSVFGLAVVMQASGNPAETTVNTVAFSAFAAIGLMVAIGLYRKPFARPNGRSQPASTQADTMLRANRAHRPHVS